MGVARGHVTAVGARDYPAVLNERWRPTHRGSESRRTTTVSEH